MKSSLNNNNNNNAIEILMCLRTIIVSIYNLLLLNFKNVI